MFSTFLKDNRRAARLRPATRFTLGISSVCCATLLATTRFLSPESAGLGTHQQLGLPPCSFRLLFGMRCPACGMTTSWSWLTRGDFVASAQANFTGMLLGVFVGCFAVIAMKSAWLGVESGPGVNRWAGLGVVGLGILCAVEWVIRVNGPW